MNHKTTRKQLSISFKQSHIEFRNIQIGVTQAQPPKFVLFLYVSTLTLGIALLTSVFKQTSSAAFATSVIERLVLTLALDSEHLKRFFDE